MDVPVGREMILEQGSVFWETGDSQALHVTYHEGARRLDHQPPVQLQLPGPLTRTQRSDSSQQLASDILTAWGLNCSSHHPSKMTTVTYMEIHQ